MSLPFVSRATHDRELAAIERLLAVAEERQADWSRIAADATAEADQAKRLHELEHRRYDELLKSFMALKMKGAEVVPVAGGIVEPPPPPPPDPLAHLKALIGERCGGNYALRGLMLRQLAVDVAANIPHDQIEASILAGVPSDGVPG